MGKKELLNCFKGEINKARIKRLCPKCLLNNLEIEMEYKFELGDQDLDSDFSPAKLYQCPNCKNIEEL